MTGMPELTTLCYLVKDGKALMLHRVVKNNDVNKDKWIGVGGHFEDGQSPHLHFSVTKDGDAVDPEEFLKR